MRYTLDTNGYVFSVSFACDLEGGTLYTGEVPSGYKTLHDWATQSFIQAYYLDFDGNLTLDYARKVEIENLQVQQSIDYAPVLRKDIFETEETMSKQYVRGTATGKVITVADIKSISPKLKITNIPPGSEKITIYTQGKNMMPCHAQAGVFSGITFTKNASGSITALGTATEPIEYTIADGKSDAIFVLKGNTDYYLNLGGLQCELRYFDGETTAQKYIGASGLLHLEESIEVTQVVVKIPSGESLNITFYPQLECGKSFTSYELYKCKKADINISEQIAEIIYPEDTLYAKDTLYPGTTPKTIDYILLEEGKVIVCINDELSLHSVGRISLFSDFTTLYCDKDTYLELEYSTSIIDVDTLEFLQGKSTTTNRFTILKDGSISAKNGYFSGRIEADSGYFKGKIEFENIYDENGKPIFDVVTQITRDTVTTAYVNALNVTAGSVRAENIIGDVFYGRTISGTTISGSTISGGTISGTTISGSTISGGTISGGTISGGSISIGSYFSVDMFGSLKASKGEIAGLTINSNSIYYGKTTLSSPSSGVYIGTDGISVGAGDVFRVTSNGSITIKADITSDAFTTLQIGGSTGVYADYTGVKVGSSMYSKLENSQLKFSNYGYIEVGYTDVAYFTSSKVSLMKSAMIGGSDYGTTVGFFGSSGTSKKTVSNLTSTTSASTVGSKLNDLLGVLRGYGLIG